MVEPQKDVFPLLKNNYRDIDGLLFEECAVANTIGYIDFYRNENTKLSSVYPDEWFFKKRDGLAFLNRQSQGGSKKYKVKSCTLDYLLKKHKIKKIDLLQIDTEGFDFEIIKQIDFKRIAPRMINYEDHHFDKRTKKDCRSLLKAKGYSLIKVGTDIFVWL